MKLVLYHLDYLWTVGTLRVKRLLNSGIYVFLDILREEAHLAAVHQKQLYLSCIRYLSNNLIELLYLQLQASHDPPSLPSSWEMCRNDRNDGKDDPPLHPGV